MLDPNTGDNKNIATKATVKIGVLNIIGKPFGRSHSNPLLDTREYEVKLEDVTTDRQFEKLIAENIWCMRDTEGKQYEIFKEIIYHKKNARAIPISNGYNIGPNGQKNPNKTTVGWEICIYFINVSTGWIPLKDVKNSNPIKLSKYTVANNIDQQPAFNWWAIFLLRKINRVINKVKKDY